MQITWVGIRKVRTEAGMSPDEYPPLMTAAEAATALAHEFGGSYAAARDWLRVKVKTGFVSPDLPGTQGRQLFLASTVRDLHDFLSVEGRWA